MRTWRHATLIIVEDPQSVDGTAKLRLVLEKPKGGYEEFYIGVTARDVLCLRSKTKRLTEKFKELAEQLVRELS